jgi:hypothetical protein
VLSVLAAFAVTLSLCVTREAHVPVHACAVVEAAAPDPIEHNAALLLLGRLKEAGLSAELTREDAPPAYRRGQLRILFGSAARHASLAAVLKKVRVAPPTEFDPGVEGYLLRSLPTLNDRAETVLAAACTDPRGLVYAAGEILRCIHTTRQGHEIATDIDLRTAPAFEVRGTQIQQSGVNFEKAHARHWTEAEREHAIADIILAGANTIQLGGDSPSNIDPAYKFVKSLGVKALCHYTANGGSGPPEWQAKESIGRSGYLCPSVPAARAEMLRQCEANFRSCPDYDYVRLVGGDGGGCECDLCHPYGHVFITLCADLADIIHKYHPNCQIFITNQKFDAESDEAIFKYLQEKPRPWLRAFCYGPGSDSMSWQPGHRQTHRMDLFKYPGFGPPSRYLHEILHQLPPEQDLVFYNEITHWRYSEFGYIQAYPRPDKQGFYPPASGHFMYERMPDRYLTQVYDRLTFFAWPRFYHKMFGETVRYGIGDCTHSSGTQDHFNQWMWERLMWNPALTAEEAVDSYCRYWFGDDAAPYMAKALFQLEQNLQDDPKNPLPEKQGIALYYALVKEAGRHMPAPLRALSWLWLEHLQKAAIDLHTALSVKQQITAEAQAEALLKGALKDGPQTYESAIHAAMDALEGIEPTTQMQALSKEATEAGELSNRLYGVRSEGLYSMKHDFIGMGWTLSELRRALAAPASKRGNLLQQIAHYQDPGPGGYYDNCGVFGEMPHVVNGSPFDYGQPLVAGMFSEDCRHSQKTMCSTQEQSAGVTLQYSDLSATDSYRVRITVVRPQFQPRYAERMKQHSEKLYAGDVLIAPEIEIPVLRPMQYEFDIPKSAIRNGELTLRFEKMQDVGTGDRVTVEQWRNTGGWGTLVSEVWLINTTRSHMAH